MCMNKKFLVSFSLFVILVAKRPANSASKYFDLNGSAIGSGVSGDGPYGWGTWNTKSDGTGLVSSFSSGDFARFAAGTDAGSSDYTVNASGASVSGVALQTNGGGTVTITGGLTISPNAGFFVGGVSTQKLVIADPISGTGPLLWQGVINGTGAGSLYLYGKNTYTVGTVVNSVGGLNFNSADSFGPPTNTITFGTNTTTYVLANPDTTGPLTIPNPVIMRNANTTVVYTGHDPVTWTSWTLGAGVVNTLRVANTGFTSAKMMIKDLQGDPTSNLVIGANDNESGTVVLTGTSAYGGSTTIGTGTTGTAILQADENAGLPTNTYLAFNGGVLQTSAGVFNWPLAVSGTHSMEWNIAGGGFAAVDHDLRVNIGSDAGSPSGPDALS